jgi:hypothetical protein
MPIERLASLVCAVALIAALLAASPLALPGPPLPAPIDHAARFTVYSLLTLLLWKAGEMPLLALAAPLLLGALDAWRPAADAADFLAGACGVLASGALLFLQRKPVCAESSPR